MIIVKKINNGFRCDMCYAKPEYEILADDRCIWRLAVNLHLCKNHAEQLANVITEAVTRDREKESI